ncbi:hypothetical protein RRG08_049320 [Elysia crispata]|uniref:Uncharacterized protein n=1 Tax=Elysia crispata TaxID=231223 RepID=A0AAE1AKP4_9GAST|nr:hypothetical protein RRG08_049320 [Elysia crispata]
MFLVSTLIFENFLFTFVDQEIPDLIQLFLVPEFRPSKTQLPRMQVFQVSLAICLVAALGCSSVAAQDVTADSVLQALGITSNMNPAQINARVAELAENLNDALDDVVGVAALIDNGQLQARLGEARVFFTSFRSGLDGKSRDEILADVLNFDVQSEQWLLALLADIGFNATDPDVADLMAGLITVYEDMEQQFNDRIKSLNTDDLREVLKQDLAIFVQAVDSVSGLLAIVDGHMVAIIIDGFQQQVQSFVDKTAGLSYDQLRVRAMPIIQTIQGSLK